MVPVTTMAQAGSSLFRSPWIELLRPPGDNLASYVGVWRQSSWFLASLLSLFSGLTATLVAMMRTKTVVENEDEDCD